MLTSAHGALSSLSTAEQIGRNFSAGTPHISNIASSNFLWFNLIKNFPTGSSERISAATVMTCEEGKKLKRKLGENNTVVS
jgi:hypothetical protein